MDELIKQAQSAGLTRIYYYATTMVANGRCTMLIYDGTLPQVNVNPSNVDELQSACNAAGIDCMALTPELAGINISTNNR